MDSKREELLTGGMGSLFIRLALPAVIGMVAIGLYQLVDAIFVGRMVGIDALGAVSLVYPLTLVNNGIATLIGIGSASVLSRAIGAKDEATKGKIFGNLVFWVVILSIGSMAALYAFAAPLVSFMGADGEAMKAYAVDYLRVVALGSILVNFAQSSNMIIRGEGKMAQAMTIMGLGTVLNIVLDPLFIGPLGLGVKGAAWATVLSQAVMAVLSAAFFLRGKAAAPVGRVRNEPDVMPAVMKVGVSAMAMQVMSLVQQTLLYKSIAHYGSGGDIAVVGSAMRLMAFSFIPVWGMSQGLQPIVGVNYGAGRLDRVRSAYSYFSIVSTIFCAVAWLAFILAPRALLGMFISDPILADSGAPAVRTMLSMFFLSGVMIMSITLFQAVGKGGAAAALIFGRQLVFFAPIMLVLPLFLGLRGVMLAAPVTDAITGALSIGFALSFFRSMKREPELNQSMAAE